VLRRALLVLVATMAALAGLAVGLPIPMGTTTAGAAAFTYDAPANARVDVDGCCGTDALHDPVSGVRDGSAPPSVEDERTSTSPSLSPIATNTADDVLRLGTTDSWGNLKTLDDHFARHGADFGATSADDYARQASDFLQQPGTLTKIDPKTGVIRVYDPTTAAFGAYNPTGTTRTFYIPDPAKHGYPTNLDYSNAQPG
jgi:hypothetical protein